MNLIFNLSMLGTRPTGMSIYSKRCAEVVNSNFESTVVSSMHFANAHRHVLSPESIVIGAENGAAIKRVLYSLNGFPRVHGLIYTPTHHGVLRSQRQIITIHDLIPIHFPKQNLLQYLYYKLIIPLLIEKSVAIFTVSETSKNEIANFYSIPRSKIYVIPNGVDSSRFTPGVSGNSETKGYLLVVGASYPHKNIHELIENCALWRGRYRLKIVGAQGRYAVHLRKLVRKMKLIGDVDFMGYVSEDDLISLYQGCTALVYPSACEGFGIPPLEAMACGRPVIASDIAALKEIGKDVPLYVSLGNYGSWKTAFEQLDDDRIVDSKVSNGLELVKTYTWGRSGSLLVHALQTVEPTLIRNCPDKE